MKRPRSKKPAPGRTARASRQTPVEDETFRRFDGKAELDRLLAASGALGDVDDLIGAFRQAIAKDVPPQPVILALWQDEPRFDDPRTAERLFSNLLGLYDLVASGAPINLEGGAPRALKPPPVAHPGPVTSPLTLEWLEAAAAYLASTKKERERLAHAFDNRLDAVVSALDDAGLSDPTFAAVSSVAFEVFALLELGGAPVGAVGLPLRERTDDLPEALATFVDDAITEAEAAETLPLPEAEVDAARALARRVASALFLAAAAPT